MDVSIAIGGFMGVGKSTVGRLVAEELGMPFIDLDDEIEESAGHSIPSLFADEGEEGFRERERIALDSLLHGPPVVLALGGGALHWADNLAWVKSRCVLVCLLAPLDVIRARIGAGETRPLWEDAQGLFNQREAGYREAHHCVSIGDDVPAAVAKEVIRMVREGQPCS